MLTAKSITKSYDKVVVLKGVDLTIQPGTITALIGPSGGGKTTLLKTLSLLDPPDAGQITINGTMYEFPLSKEAPAIHPWPQVTVVFQQLFLWPHLTLRQNITLPLRTKKKDFDNSYLETLIDLFEMRDFIDRYPNEASLGQRQRAALVRALVLDPQFVLLDEITSSLDIEQVAIILSELKTLREKGIGILLITHLLQFASEAADQVVFMESGRILEAGGTEVLRSPQNERVKRFLSLVEAAT